MTGVIDLTVQLIQKLSLGGVTLWSIATFAIWTIVIATIVWFFVRRLSR